MLLLLLLFCQVILIASLEMGPKDTSFVVVVVVVVAAAVVVNVSADVALPI